MPTETTNSFQAFKQAHCDTSKSKGVFSKQGLNQKLQEKLEASTAIESNRETITAILAKFLNLQNGSQIDQETGIKDYTEDIEHLTEPVCYSVNQAVVTEFTRHPDNIACKTDDQNEVEKSLKDKNVYAFDMKNIKFDEQICKMADEKGIFLSENSETLLRQVKNNSINNIFKLEDFEIYKGSNDMIADEKQEVFHISLEDVKAKCSDLYSDIFEQIKTEDEALLDNSIKTLEKKNLDQVDDEKSIIVEVKGKEDEKNEDDGQIQNNEKEGKEQPIKENNGRLFSSPKTEVFLLNDTLYIHINDSNFGQHDEKNIKNIIHDYDRAITQPKRMGEAFKKIFKENDPLEQTKGLKAFKQNLQKLSLHEKNVESSMEIIQDDNFKNRIFDVLDNDQNEDHILVFDVKIGEENYRYTEIKNNDGDTLQIEMKEVKEEHNSGHTTPILLKKAQPFFIENMNVSTKGTTTQVIKSIINRLESNLENMKSLDLRKSQEVDFAQSNLDMINNKMIIYHESERESAEENSNREIHQNQEEALKKSGNSQRETMEKNDLIYNYQKHINFTKQLGQVAASA